MSKKKLVKREPGKEEEETVDVVTPEICVDHDDSNYYIDVELPGVDKEHINLSVGENSICVEAARDDLMYLGCFTLAHPVREDEAKAKYDNGLLKIEIPLKAPIKGKIVKIE